MDTKRILIDGREFLPNKRTGIGCFLEGLIDALADSVLDIEIILACFYKDSVPRKLKNRERVRIKEIPEDFYIPRKHYLISAGRKLAFLTAGIHQLFRRLKFEPDDEIGQKGALCKGLKTGFDGIRIAPDHGITDYSKKMINYFAVTFYYAMGLKIFNALEVYATRI